MLGGVGPCGLTLCCSTFLTEFAPISMKMAKDQSLFLNPVKFSGVCGKLMCCLRYEHDTYVEAKKRLPQIGEIVMSPRGQGKVMAVTGCSSTPLGATPVWPCSTSMKPMPVTTTLRFT